MCGFEPKNKNKYHERLDHLAIKHFHEKLNKVIPNCQPYKCPSEKCGYVGKNKLDVTRHYTGKHDILKKYLSDKLAERELQAKWTPI